MLLMGMGFMIIDMIMGLMLVMKMEYVYGEGWFVWVKDVFVVYPIYQKEWYV